MPFIVNSPYSGRPVKVRDQDIGRALRDEENRIFYAVKKSDGSGYYGSPTRQGSEKDEKRATDMATKSHQARESGAEQSAQQIHDATGKKRQSGRLIFWLIVLAAIGLGVYYFLYRTPPANHTAPQPPGELEPLPHSQPETRAPKLEPRHTPAPFVTTATGLQYRIDELGHGPTAAAGKYVRIHYTLSIPDGPTLKTTTDARPVGFVLWSGQAIRGWDEGIAGMREGETRTLILPPHLVTGGAVGRDEQNLPDAKLKFEIALLEVLPGVDYEIVKPGEGRLARAGDAVEMHYVASIQGRENPFDNSFKRDRPLRFRIGNGQATLGLELGVVGMAEGETRSLTIPPYLAYGSRGAEPLIPPNATLRYDVTLLRILPTDRAEAMLEPKPLPNYLDAVRESLPRS